MTTMNPTSDTPRRKRQSLAHLTDEQRLEHRRAQVREAKQRYDAKQRAARPLMKTRPIAPLDAEMTAWINSIVDKPLELAALEVAVWEREHRMQVPRLEEPARNDPDRDIKHARWRQWGLIQLFKYDAIKKAQRKAREARRKEEEARTAAELGITLQEYRSGRTARALGRYKSRKEQEAAFLAKRRRHEH